MQIFTQVFISISSYDEPVTSFFEKEFLIFFFFRTEKKEIQTAGIKILCATQIKEQVKWTNLWTY